MRNREQWLGAGKNGTPLKIGYIIIIIIITIIIIIIIIIHRQVKTNDIIPDVSATS